MSTSKPSFQAKSVFQLVACGLFLLLSAYLLISVFGKRPFQGKPFAQTNLATLYGQAVSVGFHPDQEIPNANKLGEFVSKKLNTSIALQDAGLNSRFLGTIHLGGISHKTATIMAMVEDQPVLLFFDDRRKAYDECIVHGNSAIQIFEKEFEDVVAFEVTPHSKPSLLSLVSDSP